MSEDPKGFCLLFCIAKSILLIRVVFLQINISIRRTNTLEACLDKWIYLIQFIMRHETCNGRCLGGHMINLCVNLQIPKREGGIGHGAKTFYTHLDTQVDGQKVTLMVPRVAKRLSPYQSHLNIIPQSGIQSIALSVLELFVVHIIFISSMYLYVCNYEYLPS